MIVLELYKHCTHSLKRAAMLLGRDRLSFIRWSRLLGIPYFDLLAEELCEEFEILDGSWPSSRSAMSLIMIHKIGRLELAGAISGNVFDRSSRGERERTITGNPAVLGPNQLSTLHPETVPWCSSSDPDRFIE
jgi:hypothetical protein